jgi:hypothetical protein
MNILIKGVSYFAAFMIMTLVMAAMAIAVILIVVAGISFVVWELPLVDPSWRMIRLPLAIGSIFGIWFIFDENGAACASEFEGVIKKWLS